MICILAMVVFGILGLFSATHRPLAKEAFDCVFRRLTLRPCNSGFDQKMKGKIVGKLLTRSPRSARFVNKNFEILSWIMVAIFFISMIYSGMAVYNIGVHGTCTPENPEMCAFTPDQPIDDSCGECGIVGCSVHGDTCIDSEECDCVDDSCVS
jgi:hypothetical protein